MKVIKPYYRVGDIKVERRFAWLPTKITDFGDSNKICYVWLETYFSLEEFWSNSKWHTIATSQAPEYLPKQYHDRKVFKYV